MGKKTPDWLPETRDFCRTSGIKIVGWGPEMLTVEAKSNDRASEIASQLAHLGFKVVENEDNAYAGLLDLSRGPAAIEGKAASFNISHRRWVENIIPLIWALGLLLLVPGFIVGSGRYSHWITLSIGVLSSVMFVRESARIWSWKLEMHPDGLKVRRYCRWSTIPWTQIQSVKTEPGRRSSEEAVIVRLSHRASECLGTFECVFARNLRDRLRIEVAKRQPVSTQEFLLSSNAR